LVSASVTQMVGVGLLKTGTCNQPPRATNKLNSFRTKILINFT